MAIRNRNTIWNEAGNSSPDYDKFIQLPKIASANLPTAGSANEGGMVYDATNDAVYFSDGSSWATIASTGTTAYDDIGNPDANGTIAFAGYTNTWTSTLDDGTVFSIDNTDADLSADTILIDLTFKDDGDANGIFFQCHDDSASGNDLQFQIGAGGATTITGVASGAAALTITAGDIAMTSGDIDLTSGDVKISKDSQKLTLGADDATDSYLTFDGTNLTFYDSTAGSATLAQLVASEPTGDFTIANGQFNWADATAEAGGVWSFAGTTQTDIAWASKVTTGKCLAITADDLTEGDMVYLDSTVAALTSGNYIHCYDGAASDFTVAKYGATVIAGVASTDVLTVTAGDVQITAGDIDLDDGVVAIDTDNNEGNKIARNNATGTNPVLEIEQTHATGGVGFLVDQNATGDVNAIEITNAGIGYGVTITGGAATSEGFEYICGTSGAGIGLFLDGATGTNGWVGAAGRGLLEIVSDGILADADTHLVQIDKTGQTAASATGSCLHITDASTGGSTAGYAAYINASGALEALHVDGGNVQIDDALTLGIDGTAGDFIAYGDAEGKYLHWDQSEMELRLTGASILAIGGTAGAKDGLTVDFDGADVDIDAVTANDNIKFGSDIDTNVIFNTAGGAGLTIDHSGNSLTVSAAAKLVVTGDATGDGTDGLVIPNHATATPSGAADTGAIFFEVDANKLWVRTAASWVGVTLS